MVIRKDKRLETVFLSLGSNLGDRIINFQLAVNHIEREIGAVINKSSVYETEAWGQVNLNSFLNQVLELQTDLESDTLMQKCLNIEQEMGRQRSESINLYENRIIDIDILFYGDKILKNSDLEIPHYALHKRQFILIPLNELAPDLAHPSLHLTVSELLNKCTDKGGVELFTG